VGKVEFTLHLPPPYQPLRRMVTCTGTERVESQPTRSPLLRMPVGILTLFPQRCPHEHLPGYEIDATRMLFPDSEFDELAIATTDSY